MKSGKYLTSSCPRNPWVGSQRTIGSRRVIVFQHFFEFSKGTVSCLTPRIPFNLYATRCSKSRRREFDVYHSEKRFKNHVGERSSTRTSGRFKCRAVSKTFKQSKIQYFHSKGRVKVAIRNRYNRKHKYIEE